MTFTIDIWAFVIGVGCGVVIGIAALAGFLFWLSQGYFR